MNNTNNFATITGTEFVRRFFNKTYHFPSRSFFLTSVGRRVNDIVFWRLNSSTGNKQVFDPADHNIQKIVRFHIGHFVGIVASLFG